MSSQPEQRPAADTATVPAPPGAPAVNGGGDPATTTASDADARASEAQIMDALSQVYDPEIGIDIVNLGLVYGADLADDGMLTVDMTLTSPYCPMGSIIQSQAHAVVHTLPGVRDVRVNLVWSPPWDPRTMASEEAQLELGIY